MRGATLNGDFCCGVPVEHFHAVDEVAGAGHEAADVDGREDLSVERVECAAALRRRDGPEQRGRLRSAPDVRTECRDLVALALGRGDVIEANAGVDRPVPVHAPVVLHVELGVHELAVRRRVAVRFRVLRDRADQSVGEADVGVERGLTVGVEAQVAVELRGPLRRARRVLDEEARLDGMGALDLRQVAREVPQLVVAEERPPRLDVERAHGLLLPEGRR